MRVRALHPDAARGPGLHATELDVETGVSVGDLRPLLARVTGWAGWVSEAGRPSVDDRALTTDHPTGLDPLVPGVVLRPWPAPPVPDPLLAAAHEPHVAVVAGPDAGHVLPLARGSRAVVGGRSRAGDARTGRRLALDDAAMPDVEVTRVGCLTVVRVAGARRRVWRPGRVLQVGSSVLALRPGARRPRRPGLPRREEVEPGADRDDPGSRGLRGTRALWLVPLSGGVALGVMTHRPWLALTGLLVPAATLLGSPRRRRPAARPAPSQAADLPALAVATAAAALGPASAGAAARDDTPPPGGVEVDGPWDPAGSLAVVGPRAAARAVTRAVALAALGSHGRPTLTLRADDLGAWSWASWLTEPDAPLPDPADGPAVVVLDSPTDAAVAAWRAAAPPRHRLLLVVRERAHVPSWCTATIDATPAPPPARAVGRRVRAARPRAPSGRPAAAGVSPAWADAQARRLAAARHRARRDPASTEPELPGAVTLASLPGVPAPTAAAIAHSWAHGPRALTIGVGSAGRAVHVDLRRDGPHALVAGTTGAGKSALLTTLVLAHALAEPPDRLAILLVDFKGGAGLGPVAGLPHVLDHVTDLDSARARRVLVGLAAELRRREGVLAELGATDLAELDPADRATPPRLLVVVDELRALADDVPDAMPALARIAAQGRSLGVHLVLATQRPAGAVPADLRANVGLRVCLRVADPADSTDVLDDPAAAGIDAARPGRALLRVAGGPLVAFQAARATTGSRPPLRHARPWSSVGARWVPAAASRDVGPAPWVAAARDAACDRPTATTPWLPELPLTVPARDVPPGRGLPLGLADLPAEQRRGPVRWDPADGHLLVVGGPGSGRTSTLVAIAAQAVRAGRQVHAIGLTPRDAARLRELVPPARLGSVLPADEPVAVARALELLTSAARAVLLVDGLDTVLDELADLARGAGAQRLVGLLRAPATDLGVVATAPATAAGLRHAAAFRTRLVLALSDETAAALAGVPRDLTGGSRPPGRAVHLHDGAAVLCQLALPPAIDDEPSPVDDDPSAVPSPDAHARLETRHRPGRTAPPPPARVAPLPRRADRPRRPAAAVPGHPATAALGLGGDAATEMSVDLDVPLLVAGPPGSGRTTALDVLAAHATWSGHTVVRLAPFGPPRPASAPFTSASFTSAQVTPAPFTSAPSAPAPPSAPASLAPASAAAPPADGARPAGATTRRTGWALDAASAADAARLLAAHPDALLLVDDLDELERDDASVADLVASRDHRIAVATTAQAAATASTLRRGPLAGLVRRRRLLVLAPRDPASAELIGPRAPWLVDPRGCPPGRGALVDGRSVVPVQVYA